MSKYFQMWNDERKKVKKHLNLIKKNMMFIQLNNIKNCFWFVNLKPEMVKHSVRICVYTMNCTIWQPY